MKADKIADLKVGIFVLLGIVGFIAAVLLLGGNQFVFGQKYQLKILLDQSQGLDKGSLVSFAGINVGHVASVRYESTSTEVELTLDIDKKYKTKITNHAIAKIKTQGALGDKFIFIEPGATGGEALADGALIKSEQSQDFLDLLTGKSTDLESVSVLIKELSTLVKNMNAENRSAVLMENLSATSKNLKGLTNDPALANSVKRLNNILTKIDQGQGSLGRLINEPTLHERLLDLLGESKRNRYLKPLIQESSRSSSAP